MEMTTFERAAYAMQDAYKTECRMVEAISKVKSEEEFSRIPYNILQAMWTAIDAYVDINT